MVLAVMELIFLLKGDSEDAVFWVFDENSGDSTLMLFVSTALQQHRVKDFPASLAALPVRRLGMQFRISVLLHLTACVGGAGLCVSLFLFRHKLGAWGLCA